MDSENVDIFSQQPGVTTSSSGDTLCQPGSSDSLFADSIVSISSCIAGPYTPEALRGRKSPEEIREELGLPCRKLDWNSSPKMPPVSDRMTTSCASPACSVLPPMFGAWGALPSPQVSTSSFYSKSSRPVQNIARSPSLKLGQAKTAVGALLALNESRSNQPRRAQESARLPPESSILPCREWLQDDRSVDEANDFSIELPYESLNESQGGFSHKSYGFNNASDEESSIHASPSSNRGNFSRNLPNTSFTRGFLQAEASRLSEDDMDHYDFHPIMDRELVVADEQDATNVSCMSQSTLKEMESMCSMAGELDVTGPYSNVRSEEEHFRSQNERRIKEDLLLSTLERLQDDNEIVLEVMDAMKETSGHFDVSMRPGEDNLFAGFSSSSRGIILQSIDTRLSVLRSSASTQTGSNMIIEALAFCRSLVHASVPTCEKIGNIQRYVAPKRRGASYLNSFALKSFSPPSFSNLHHSSNSAFTPQHGHRWKHIAGFRAALGFDEVPQSPPTIRGGDTSLFSLPSESANDATPHTSNVSMTSTITSALSPDAKGNRHSGYFLRRGNLRQSMESVCAAFDTLSAECSKLAKTQPEKASDSSMKTIEIIYRQLLSVPNDELKSLIDSFELDLLNFNITRMVSEDQGDEMYAKEPTTSFPQPLPLVRSWGLVDNGGYQPLGSESSAHSLQRLELNLIEDEREDRENYDLFSPNTLDMQSIEQSSERSPTETIEEDDLRRTVGSFDQEEVVEEREAAPAVVPQQQPARAKWSKGRLAIFKRRNFRKRLAAE